MASLTALEKRSLERLFDMGGGYVLNFSNRTFHEFVLDAVRKDIYDDRYSSGGGSKANRLRTFWRVEPDQVVASLLDSLLDLVAREFKPDAKLLEDCRRAAARLRTSAPVPDLDAIEPNADGRDFEVLAKSVRESIENNEPEAGLDHLHTFVIRYVRVLAKQEGIDTPMDKPLHSLFGELVKALRRRHAFETEMTERILKSSISTLDAFNDVRNNRSLAHDNPLLGYNEALLIFNHVASSIRFLATVAASAGQASSTELNTDDE